MQDAIPSLSENASMRSHLLFTAAFAVGRGLSGAWKRWKSEAAPPPQTLGAVRDGRWRERRCRSLGLGELRGDLFEEAAPLRHGVRCIAGAEEEGARVMVRAAKFTPRRV